MAKYALCMSAAKAHSAIAKVREAKSSLRITDPDVINSVLNLNEVSLQDRKYCETDPSCLQFIPYVVCRDQSGQVFNYTRGGASGEQRLVAQKSVGVGGHVDILPLAQQHLKSLFQEEAAREILEEIGVEVAADDITIEGVLVDATSPVQEVHLGLLCMYKMKEGDVIDPEINVIEGGSFLPAHTINRDREALEQWSKLAIDHVLELPQGE